MTYEQLIAAKVRLIETENTAALWVAAGLAVIATISLFVAIVKDGDWRAVAGFVAACAYTLAVTISSVAWWTLSTADIKARADLASYGLVELKK